MMEPTNGKSTELVKLTVASAYVMTPLGLLVYRLYTGGAPDSTILLIVIIFMFASGYVVFGERTVDKATDSAKEVTGDDNG